MEANAQPEKEASLTEGLRRNGGLSRSVSLFLQGSVGVQAGPSRPALIRC